MPYNTIKTEERDGIYIITLNRPEAKNAMNSEMWQELCCAFDHLEETDSLRCCIMTNVGDCFCAGSDLKEIAAGTYHAPEGYERDRLLRHDETLHLQAAYCGMPGACFGRRHGSGYGVRFGGVLD